MKTTIHELLDKFRKARKDFLETLEKFPADKREKVLFGEWNLKQVIAHFAAWDIYFANVLKLLKQNKPVIHWGNINKFNEIEVSKRKNWSWEEIYQEFVESGEEFIKEYNQIPKELEEKIIWPDKKYTPLKFLKVNIHHYQKAQLQEIKKYIAKLK
jgi:hypothetical protein